MFRYTVQRIFLALVTTVIILTLTFFLVKLQPFPATVGDTTAQLTYYTHQVALGYVVEFRSAQPNLGTPLYSAVDSFGVSHFFYQKPIFDQFCVWVSGLFHGSWGVSSSISPNVDAMKIIVGTSWTNSRLFTTVKVNIWPVLISVPLGLGLGVWAALKKNKLTDHVISTLVMVFISVPSFITINFLLLLFSYEWGWFPSQWPSVSAPLQTRVLGYFIPTMALSFGSICGYCRFTRAELTEVMSSDYLLLARTKGLTRSQAITRHALKNAMVPVLPSILSEIIGLLGGSMILESLYGIPGVGRLYIDSISAGDYNVLMADMSLYTLIGLISGVFLDLSYGFIDPRIRMGAKK